MHEDLKYRINLNIGNKWKLEFDFIML